MDVVHPKCAGLDVHQQTVVACARVGSGKTVTHAVRTFGSTTPELLALSDWLATHGCTHVAMESTGVYWKPVWHVLDGHFELVLANAMHIRNIPGRKSDVNDATWIADLLAHGLVRSSFGPPEPIQELRDLTRTRKQLTREIARHTLRIQKTLDQANIKLTGLLADILGVSGRAILDALVGGERDPERLGELGKRRSTRTLSGNRWLKTTLVQAAWSAVRKDNTYFRAQFLRLKARRGPKKAIVAVAASILTAAYHVLRRGVDYSDLGGDHFNRRDKAKLARRLIARLHDLGLAVEVRAA